VRLTRPMVIQLIIFTVVGLIAGSLMVFDYIKLPALLFGVGHYTVTVELPEAAGLYKTGNVTYRGTEVGRVEDVRLTHTGSRQCCRCSPASISPLISTPRCTASRRSVSNSSR